MDAHISINNGTSTTTVDALTDEEVHEIVSVKQVAWDDEIRESAHRATDGDERDWLTIYCRAHEARFGSPLVIG